MEEMSGQVGGGAGRWKGPGVVYVMTYTYTYKCTYNDDTDDISCQTMNCYKIGCTSRDPETRLKEVERKERKHRGNNSVRIKLLGFVHVDEMRDAETKAQKYARTKLDLEKDSSRGNATDWFTGDATGEQVLDAVGEACECLVYVLKRDFGNDIYYSKKGTNITDGSRYFMTITAQVAKEADECESG
jgi:hypothetical protein